MRLSHFRHRYLSSRSRHGALMGLSLWLAILGILATLNADVFEQVDGSVWSFLTLSFERLLSEEPDRIPLSSLLGEPRQSLAARPAGSPLYVFALDVSGSMAEQPVSEAEMEVYRNGVHSSYPADQQAPCREPRAAPTGFDVARVELCRYLDAVPLGSRAALWTFDDQPRPAVPNDSSLGDRYIPIELTPGGGTTKNRIYKALEGLVPTQGNSNFEALLGALARSYQPEIDGSDEAHFVIISDFAHDLRGRSPLTKASAEPASDLAASSLMMSRNRLSLAIIEEQFRNFSKSGKTFHLSEVLGARRIVCSVLPVVTGAMDWSAYRVVRMQPEQQTRNFDFLRSFEEVDSVIPFYYSAGASRPLPALIDIDDPKLAGSRLQLALAYEAGVEEQYPARIEVTFGSAQPGIVRTGRAQVGEIFRSGEVVKLQPLLSLEPQESSSYRLLVSWHNGAPQQVGAPTTRTYAMRIVFRKRLTWIGALALTLAIGCTCLFGLWLLAIVLLSLIGCFIPRKRKDSWSHLSEKKK